MSTEDRGDRMRRASPDAPDRVRLGDSTVRRMAFGAMRLAGPGILGPPTARDHSIRASPRAVEIGVDHIDTTDAYGFRVVEDILHETLHPYPRPPAHRHEVGPGATAARRMGAGRPSRPSAPPVRDEPAAKLGVDRIDLLYLHRVDPDVPFADQIGTMKEMSSRAAASCRTAMSPPGQRSS